MTAPMRAMPVLLCGLTACNAIYDFNRFREADGSIDGSMSECGWPFVPINVDPCEGSDPGTDWLVEDGVTVTYDTGDGTADTGTSPESAVLEQLTLGEQVRVVTVRNFDVQGTLVVTGSLALVVVVWGMADVSGLIELSGLSHGECTVGTGGAGSDYDGPDPRGGSGGGGGGFGAAGGAGGDSQNGPGGTPGMAFGDPMLSPLRGGCPGGDGGDIVIVSGGRGGAPGGAIQIVVRGPLDISGVIRSSGLGGQQGRYGGTKGSGGGGGGSGGGIVLQADEVRLTSVDARVCANGGSGGAGGHALGGEMDGQPGSCEFSMPALGGTSNGPGGGDGGVAGRLGGEGGPGGDIGTINGGGGGGGGVGRIRVDSVLPAALGTDQISPVPYTDP